MELGLESGIGNILKEIWGIMIRRGNDVEVLKIVDVYYRRFYIYMCWKLFKNLVVLIY